VPRGEIAFDATSFPSIRNLFADGSVALAEAAGRAGAAAKGAGDVERIVQMMAGCGYLMPAARSFAAPALPKTLARCAVPSPVNRAFLDQAAATITRRYLASEVLGNAVPIGPVEAMALLHLTAAKDGAAPGRDALIAAVHSALRASGARITLESKKEKPSADPLHDVAADQVGRLLDRTLPVLQRAGIVACG
jgi:hypothetical protein